MPLLLVLILVLIAFGLLLVGFLTSSVLWAWVSVLVSAVAAVVLVVDTLQRRSAVRAGDDAREPVPDGARAAGHGVPAETPGAVAARPGAAVDGATALVPVPGRPAAPRRSDPVDPVTAVIPVVRSGGWRAGTNAEQTVVMPVVRPSGSPDAPPGAPDPVPPSGESLLRSVKPEGDEAPEGRSVPAGAAAAATPPDATVVVPAAATGRRLAGAGATQVMNPAEEPDAPPAVLDPDQAASPDADTAAPPVARGSSAAPVDGSSRAGSDDGSAAPPPGDVPVPSGPGSRSGSGSGAAPDAGSGPTGSGADGPVGRSPTDAPAGDPPPADVAPTGAPPADVPPVEVPPVEVPAAQAPAAPAEPPAEESEADAAALVARLEDEVLVVDERPRYHMPGCRTLLAAPIIPLPAREAVELGFSPCGWCTPDRTLAARHAAARS